MAEQLDPRLEHIIDTVAAHTEEARFALCGGVILDTLLHKPVADYDIVIEEDPSHERIAQLANTLQGHGYDVPVQGAPYFVKINTPATLMEAVKDETILDIGFAPSYDIIPYFKIDSTYITYPEKQIVDTFDAMGAFERQDLSLARGIDEENPYMITARLLNLAAKYDVPLQNANALLKELSERMQLWTPPHEFHVGTAEAAAKDALKAIARSSDPQAFSHAMLESQALTQLFPEAIAPLTSLVCSSTANWPATKQELLAYIIEDAKGSQPQRSALAQRLGAAAIEQ